MTIRARRLRAAMMAAAAVSLAGGAHALPMRGYLNVRTISVSAAAPAAPAAGIANDLSYMGQIYRQIGITTIQNSASSIVLADPDADGNWTSAEVTGNLLNQSRGLAAANEFHMYYVNNYRNGSPVAQAWSNEDVGANTGAVTNPGRNNDTVAHEAGHVLVDRWRWRRGQGDQDNNASVHSNNANNLMATSAAPVNRNVPANINQVAPQGNFDQIGFEVGPRSNAATVAQPQISAMWFNSGLVNVTRRDFVNLRVGPTGGAEVSTGQIPWAETATINAAGRNITIDTAARQIGNNQEQYTLYFRADAAFAGLPAGQRTTFSLFDLASVDIPFTDFLVGGTTEVRTFADVVDPAGGGNGTLLTFGAANDYTRGAVFSGGVLNNLMININNERLNGVRDVWVTFTMQVPAPASAALVLLGGFAASRRRRT